jgi:hypothetical protein
MGADSLRIIAQPYFASTRPATPTFEGTAGAAGAAATLVPAWIASKAMIEPATARGRMS